MEPTTVHPELTTQCLEHVFSHLPVRDAVRAACVQRLWRDLIQTDERLWARFMLVDLGLSVQRGADGEMKHSFMKAYGSWRGAYGPEYWPYLPRAIKAWELILGWLASHYPAIRETVQGGASEQEVEAVEASLGFKLPPALKVLYRLHDGQALPFDAAHDRTASKAGKAAAGAGGGSGAGAGSGESAGDLADRAREAASIFHGLFGGYSVYNHMVVTRMMPLKRAAVWKEELELHKLRPQLLPFACSFRVQDRLMVADASSGGLAVMRRRARGCVLQPVVPAGQAPEAMDGVLRWFEEYARRLAGGWYEVAPMDEDYPQDTLAISLFPLAQPGMVEAVTRGVRVRASVVYVPEGTPLDRHFFAYSIRFALLGSDQPGGSDPQPQQAGRAAAAVRRCQLVSRHWVIRDEHGAVVDEVEGEGVIGKYPLLEPGGPEFVYCSCTHQAATHGSMEGEFRFVEGTIDQPTGDRFDVVCPAFRLDVPAFIF